MKYRLLVTGSRNLSPREAAYVTSILAPLYVRLSARYDYVTLVHGGCPTGVDDLADRLGIVDEIERYPADWDRHGKGAGIIRNSQMVKLGAHKCVAFPAKNSPGTWDCLTKAAKAGIQTVIYPLLIAAGDDR